ncbi:MAG: hypothetical protein LBL93_01055 [Ruminococcus sp.]|jgi:hypothetical protein|nr:hypothetical protein [Ruminococcus sp.]
MKTKRIVAGLLAVSMIAARVGIKTIAVDVNEAAANNAPTVSDGATPGEGLGAAPSEELDGAAGDGVTIDGDDAANDTGSGDDDLDASVGGTGDDDANNSGVGDDDANNSGVGDDDGNGSGVGDDDGNGSGVGDDDGNNSGVGDDDGNGSGVGDDDKDKSYVQYVVFENSGDADGDGAITGNDALDVAKFIVKKLGTDGLDTAAADVDGDGKVGITDLVMICKSVVGIPTVNLALLDEAGLAAIAPELEAYNADSTLATARALYNKYIEILG